METAKHLTLLLLLGLGVGELPAEELAADERRQSPIFAPVAVTETVAPAKKRVEPQPGFPSAHRSDPAGDKRGSAGRVRRQRPGIDAIGERDLAAGEDDGEREKNPGACAQGNPA